MSHPALLSSAGTLPEVIVRPGSLLLADAGADPSFTAHRDRTGPVPLRHLATLQEWTQTVNLRGRGGAGFPFAVKLAAAAERRGAVLVVNAAEGEPASRKDEVLLRFAPHLVLDGAVIAARALGCKEIHVVTPSAKPAVGAAVERAVAERRHARERVRWRRHVADDRFVAGQARAVLELMAGRPNLPVTAWKPEAIEGHRGRPTLLSNAETFAHVAALARIGPARYTAHGQVGSPGTVLLTVDGDGAAPEVLELPAGTPLRTALATRAVPGQPVLLGGYHGTWLSGDDVARVTLDRARLADEGFALGAGVALPLPPGQCPVIRTAGIVRYLANESAGRCGPCRLGLPTLADELDRLARCDLAADRIRSVAEVVTGRGACAHPDGTARLARSMLDRFAGEVQAHELGICRWGWTGALR